MNDQHVYSRSSTHTTVQPLAALPLILERLTHQSKQHVSAAAQVHCACPSPIPISRSAWCTSRKVAETGLLL